VRSHDSNDTKDLFIFISYFCSMCEQERGLDQSNILAADLEECRSRLADRDHQFKELLHRLRKFYVKEPYLYLPATTTVKNYLQKHEKTTPMKTLFLRSVSPNQGREEL
jgi:hypothetical protein